MTDTQFNFDDFDFDMIYLNCGIVDGGSLGDVLFIANPGYDSPEFYASEAWTVGDNFYSIITAGKFYAVTADNNEEYLLDRNKIRRVKNIEEVIKLLDNSHEVFLEEFLYRFSI